MLAHVLRPLGDAGIELPGVTRKQVTRGLLEARQVAGHDRHEPEGALLRPPYTVLAALQAAGLVDELAQRHRRAAGLAVQPFPMPRQERDFPRHHAELRPAGAGLRLR